MTPHADSARLARAVQRCLSHLAPWNGVFYRLAAPSWATAAHLLTGDGGLHGGGRWHPIGAFRAVYASLEVETALAESLAHQRRYGLSEADAMPKTINAVRASLTRVLYLKDGVVRRALVLSEARILSERWWLRGVADEEAITQALGRLAREAGIEALRVPSAARRGGQGIVYFPDNRHASSTLEIVHEDRLPTHVP